jgi:hypothetical protein
MVAYCQYAVLVRQFRYRLSASDTGTLSHFVQAEQDAMMERHGGKRSSQKTQKEPFTLTCCLDGQQAESGSNVESW